MFLIYFDVVAFELIARGKYFTLEDNKGVIQNIADMQGEKGLIGYMKHNASRVEYEHHKFMWMFQKTKICVR